MNWVVWNSLERLNGDLLDLCSLMLQNILFGVWFIVSFVLVCVCTYMCVCVCICMCVCVCVMCLFMCAWTCRSPMMMSYPLLFILFFEARSLTEFRNHKLARLNGQWAPEILLLPFLQCWGNRYIATILSLYLFIYFLMSVGDPNLDPCASIQALAHLAISPTSGFAFHWGLGMIWIIQILH